MFLEEKAGSFEIASIFPNQLAIFETQKFHHHCTRSSTLCFRANAMNPFHCNIFVDLQMLNTNSLKLSFQLCILDILRDALHHNVGTFITIFRVRLFHFQHLVFLFQIMDTFSQLVYPCRVSICRLHCLGQPFRQGFHLCLRPGDWMCSTHCFP